MVHNAATATAAAMIPAPTATSRCRDTRLCKRPCVQEAPAQAGAATVKPTALVYACLLHLTGHQLSALFRWQLAAGADTRAVAYCLHLHHLAAGGSRRARHWYHEVTRSTADTTPPDTVFLTALEIFVGYVRANGSRAHPRPVCWRRRSTGWPPARRDRLHRPDRPATRVPPGGVHRRPL
ncbi:hypothetical protein ACIQNG_33555 [Streptomyces sp. NPDC091377]|uniref:hypothetical protein n=1 Tax=Streptomyces sp. NPDC091377 TaxID=3365995 RepID=UPI003812CB73